MDVKTNKSNCFVLFLKGLLTGAAAVVPALSSGMAARIMGINAPLERAFLADKNGEKPSAVTVLSIVVGLVIGAAAFTVLVFFALIKFSFILSCLFFGMSLRNLLTSVRLLSLRLGEKNAEENNQCETAKKGGNKNKSGAKETSKRKPINKAVIITIVIFAAFSALVVAVGFIPESLLSVPYWSQAYIFAVAVLCGASLAVPTVSGALILVAFKAYKPLVTAIKTVCTFWAGGEVVFSLLIFSAAAVGAIVGYMWIFPLVRKLLKKQLRYAMSATIGINIGLTTTIAIVADYANLNGMTVMLGAAAVIMGFTLIAFLEKMQSKAVIRARQKRYEEMYGADASCSTENDN